MTTAERARVDAARARLLQLATLLHGVLEDGDQGKVSRGRTEGLWDLCEFIEGVNVTTTITRRHAPIIVAEKGGPR